MGIGLSKQFDAMDVYKLTSYVVAIGGIIGLVIYLTAMNAPDLGIQTLLWINSVVLYRRSGLVCASRLDCRSGTHRFRIGVSACTKGLDGLSSLRETGVVGSWPGGS